MVNFWPQIWYLGINLKDILVGVFLLDSLNQQAVREAARYAPPLHAERCSSLITPGACNTVKKELGIHHPSLCGEPVGLWDQPLRY